MLHMDDKSWWCALAFMHFSTTCTTVRGLLHQVLQIHIEHVEVSEGKQVKITFRPRSTRSFITPMNSLWLRQSSPSMSKSLNTVSSTFSESSWPVAIFTARLNWAAVRRKRQLYGLQCRERTTVFWAAERCYLFPQDSWLQTPFSSRSRSLPGCWWTGRKIWTHQMWYSTKENIRADVEATVSLILTASGGEESLYLTRRNVLPHVFPVDFVVFCVGVV